jgi:hypothetical protein
MYSSENLIVNGGLARVLPDRLHGWDFVRGERSDASWQRVAVPHFDRAGIPHSAYAVVLSTHDRPGGAHLRQAVHPRDGLPRRFALRLAARGATGHPDCTLVVAVADAAVPDEPRVVGRLRFRASPRWERHRVSFDVPAEVRRPVVHVHIHGSDQPHSAVAVTDVRLVGLFQAVEDVAIRFDTCGDLSRASSRLRAWMLEDYLHLVGCRTSTNGGNAFTVLVCQKVCPWLKLARARLAGRVVVFDLDDADLLASPRKAWHVRRFARAVDGTSVGSECLREMMTRCNLRPFLLENPVDVLDRDVVHRRDRWQGRLVWFGMPENVWMLKRLGLDRSVTTITRGGDIEYGLKTIDEHLVTFDLALLPVVLNEETLAKNANRLVKCVGLGLPFLASDTLEHRRALERLRLPDEFLVASEHDWPARIEDVARRYPHYKRAIDEARPRAFETYGVERIAHDWMQFCAELLHARAASGQR